MQKYQKTHYYRNKMLLKTIIPISISLGLCFLIYFFVLYQIGNVVNYAFALACILSILITVILAVISNAKFEDEAKKATIETGVALGIFFALVSAVTEFIPWETINGIDKELLDFLHLKSELGFSLQWVLFIILSVLNLKYLISEKHITKQTIILPFFIAICDILITDIIKNTDFKLLFVYGTGLIGIILFVFSAVPKYKTVNKIFFISKGVLLMIISLAVISFSVATIVVPTKELAKFTLNNLNFEFEEGSQILWLLANIPAIIIFVLSIYYVRGRNPWKSNKSSSTSSHHYSSASSYSHNSSSKPIYSGETYSEMYDRVSNEIKKSRERWAGVDDLMDSQDMNSGGPWD